MTILIEGITIGINNISIMKIFHSLGGGGWTIVFVDIAAIQMYDEIFDVCLICWKFIEIHAILWWKNIVSICGLCPGTAFQEVGDEILDVLFMFHA